MKNLISPQFLFDIATDHPFITVLVVIFLPIVGLFIEHLLYVRSRKKDANRS